MCVYLSLHLFPSIIVQFPNVPPTDKPSHPQVETTKAPHRAVGDRPGFGPIQEYRLYDRLVKEAHNPGIHTLRGEHLPNPTPFRSSSRELPLHSWVVRIRRIQDPAEVLELRYLFNAGAIHCEGSEFSILPGGAGQEPTPLLGEVVAGQGGAMLLTTRSPGKEAARFASW